MTSSLYDAVSKNQYGFYELADAFRKSMRRFYEEEYFQNDCAVYQRQEYPAFELEHKAHIFSEKELIVRRNTHGGGGTFLT